MFCQGGPCWQTHMLSEMFVFHGPQSFEGLVQATSGEGSPATRSPLGSVTPHTRRKPSQIAGVVGLPRRACSCEGDSSGCPGVWSLWASFTGVDGTFLFGGTSPATPSCSSKRASQGEFSIWSQGKSPTPPSSRRKLGLWGP